jgi:hypothetical protein
VEGEEAGRRMKPVFFILLSASSPHIQKAEQYWTSISS